MVALTTNFLSLTGIVVAADIGNNFNDLNGAISGNLTSAGLHPTNAGITKYQLLHRYTKDTVVIPFVPEQGDGTLQTPSTVPFPSAMTLGPRIRRKTKSGDLDYIASMEIHVTDAPASTPFPRIELRKNGTLVPGAQFDLDTDNEFFFMERSNPLDNPFLAFTNNDRFEIWYGSSTGAGNPEARGVTIYITFKQIHMS